MSMSVPSGYKQTKIGVIPEDWDVVKTRDICTFYSGGTPTSTNKEYYNGHIPFIGSGNINDTDVNQFITQKALDNSSAKLVNKGDLLYALYGATSGEVAISKISGAINQAILCIRSKENLYFLHQFFLLHKDKIIATFLQGGQGNLSADIIKKLEIPLPPLKEQEKISQILSTWDDAISKRKALIKAKEELKKGLMQKLLSGEVRFDEFDEEWKEVRFNTVFERVTRKNTINDTNVLTISAQHGLINQEEFFNKSVASKDLSGYILLKNGEFAYNKSYSNGYPMGAVKRLNRYEQGVLSSLYIYFAMKDGDSDFYEHYFEAGFLNKEIYKIAQEGARNHGLLNMSVIEFFNDMHILKPPLEEQEKIAEVLTLADKEIELLKNELEALKEQKRGLMQRLLSGEVRVQ